MNRDSLLRFLLIAGVGLGVWYFFLRPGSGPAQPGPPLQEKQVLEEKPDEKLCEIQGSRFKAAISTHNATVKRWLLDGTQYTVDGSPSAPPMDLVTTPSYAQHQPLRVSLGVPVEQEVPQPEILDYQIAEQSGTSCTLSWSDGKTKLTKVIRATGKPFELESTLTVANVGAAKASHRVAMEASAFRFAKEVEGGFGRQSPFLTSVECSADGKLTDKAIGDFSPDDFKKPEFKEGGWFTVQGKVDYASVSNFYFAQALVPMSGAPSCQVQIWDRGKDFGAFYRSRLAWPVRELAPGESDAYKVLLFSGPKEREVLAGAAGGERRVGDLIKLGTFAIIAKVLVAFLIKAKTFLGSWGLAIIVLTITVRTVLFPLTWRQIKSGAQMRQLKPEIDKLNEKFKDDAQQKQLATMELWKKHGVNPLSGCLPVVAQMPVWFALYTSLQTAAELYHTPFLWFRDLSAPDTIHIASWDAPFLLPVLLGATTFIQQKLMPQQMDPAQQKMMTYMMPAVFTAMMLFLPAGLGVYMFTNSVLGIAQTLAVEKYYAHQQASKSKPGGGGGSGIEVREKETSPTSDAKPTRGAGGKETPSLPLGKGNARV